MIKGYIRRDGKVGFRNLLLVVPTTGCQAEAARRISDALPGSTYLYHPLGCSSLGKDLDLLMRSMEGITLHPNVGAILFVEMGCAQLSIMQVHKKAVEAGKIVERVNFHKEGGTSKTINRGTVLGKKLLQKLEKMERRTVPTSSLIIGTKCGSSNPKSFTVAHPILGQVCNRLVDEGATVVLSENFELFGAEDILLDRAIDETVAQQIRLALQRTKEDAERLGFDFEGEVRGGNQEVKRQRSLGHIAKAGTRPIQKCISFPDEIKGPGLVFLDAPNTDLESVTALMASGCQLIAFTTGNGTPMGSPVSPVIKIACNTKMAQKMEEIIDFNAGEADDGIETFEQSANRLYNEIIRVANGNPTKAEELRHFEISFPRYGVSF